MTCPHSTQIDASPSECSRCLEHPTITRIEVVGDEVRVNGVCTSLLSDRYRAQFGVESQANQVPFSPRVPRRCSRCGGVGHRSDRCEAPPTEASSDGE